MKESAVNSSIIIGTARYIISHDNKSLLIENCGHIPSTVWAKSVMLLPNDFEEMRQALLH